MAQQGDRSSTLAARVLMALLALGAVVGLALAGWLAFDAIPDSAWGTARTPAMEDSVSPLGRRLSGLYRTVFFMAVAVFVLVEGLILYAAVRFRRKPGDPEPRQVHGDNRAEVAWTIAPTIIVLILAYLSYGVMQERFTVNDDDALIVNATGWQWWWEFEYPAEGFSTATEMVVPAGRSVRVMLDSSDVLHSFWAPQLAGKYDAVPGVRDGGSVQNSIWFVAEEPGRYEGQCAELCGTQHAGMRFTVIAVEEAEYEAWASAHAELPQIPDEDANDAVWRGFDTLTGRGACLTCHTMDGLNARVPEGEEAAWPPPAAETRGPNLTRMASRTRLSGGVYAHTRDNVSRWIDRPDSMKVGTKMQSMGLNQEQIDDVLTYLYSLKLDDEVMAPIYAVEPASEVVPPAHDGLERARSGEVVEAAAEGHGEGD